MFWPVRELALLGGPSRKIATRASDKINTYSNTYYNTYMTTRKSEDNNIRKLTRVGKTSLAVTIPVAIVNKLRLRERQKVVVTERGGVITIKDWTSQTDAAIKP